MCRPTEAMAIKYDISEAIESLTPPPLDKLTIPIHTDKLVDYFISIAIESYGAIGVFPPPVPSMGPIVDEWLKDNNRAYRLLWNSVKPPVVYSGHYALLNRIGKYLWIYYIINGEENL